MRNAFVIIVVLVFLSIVLAACDETAPAPAPESKPIASGFVISGTLWQEPVSKAGSKSGNPVSEGSRVEVYEDFIIVTSPNGVSELSLHGWYTNLKFKRE